MDQFSLLILLSLISQGWTSISSMGYVPLATEPLLYNPGYDAIVHLDQNTFSDTIYHRKTAFLVEFYANWCGHCRAFAPVFKQFAYSVLPWRDVVTIAAINCADHLNMAICREQDITGYPTIKYYPWSSSIPVAILLAKPTAGELRVDLAQKIANEYSQMRYTQWPNLIPAAMNGEVTPEQLWATVPQSINFLVLIIEQYDMLGVPFLLDMHPYRSKIMARRLFAPSGQYGSLQIKQYPAVVLFMRNKSAPLYFKQYNANTVVELLSLISSLGPEIQSLPATSHRVVQQPKTPIISCHKNPQRCRRLYYVSETDMLKAARMALFDEVLKTKRELRQSEFVALYNFVALLSEQFPAATFSTALPRRYRRAVSASPVALDRSERARLVFGRLREALHSRIPYNSVETSWWERNFLDAERLYGHPFPINSSWEHCKGSSPEFRGYTCGLWTTFHAITVHSYMRSLQGAIIKPIKPLRIIRSWVKHFFGCRQCAQHFLTMTTKLYPMNEQRIFKNEHTMMYLWSAHNIVNRRLHGDSTEDPQFKKMQFPPTFLCEACHVGKNFNRQTTRNFLLRYYGNIIPPKGTKLVRRNFRIIRSEIVD